MNQAVLKQTPLREIIQIDATIKTELAKTKVAGYARVSSSSDDQLNSFSTQVNYYTSLISNNQDWEFVDVYADEGITGVSTEKRDDFNRMISDCKKGKIDRIITKSISRFSRNTVDSLKIARELKAIGVTIHFEKENIDTSKLTSEVLFTLYSNMAEQESMTISQNCKKANRMRMQMGTYVSSSAPYGYRLVNKELVIHEEEANIVRRIFNEYINGKGKRKIADDLNKEGVLRKNGKEKWYASTIDYLLRNERYIGASKFQKRFTEDVIPYKKKRNHGELPMYYVQDTHIMLIDPVTYEIARILYNKKSTQRNEEQIDYTLSRKISCSSCGKTFRKKVDRNKSYWVCKQHDDNSEYCSNHRYTEKSIYTAFIEMYNKLQDNKNILLSMRNNLSDLQEKAYKNNTEIMTINKQIAELTTQNHVLSELMSTGVLDSALFISQTDNLNRQIIELKQAKSRIVNESLADVLLKQTEDLIDMLDEMPEYLTEMNDEIFSDIVEKIKLANNSEIQFTLMNGITITERIE